jgi:proteasome accessory factor B
MDRTESLKAMNLAEIVLKLVMDPKGYRLDDIRKDFGVSRSTMFHYLKQLRDLQVAALRDQATGKSLLRTVKDGETSYLRLDRLEEPPEERQDFFSRVLALQMARQAFGFLGDTELKGHLDALAKEFEDHIRQRHYAWTHLLRNMDRAILFLPRAPKSYRGQRLKLNAILRGLEGPYRLRVTYGVPGEKAWTRVVEPLTLVVWDSALYLFVRSPEGGYVYTLAVDRIRKVQKTGEAFHYPPRADYDPRDLVEGYFGPWGGDDKPVDVELIFADIAGMKQALRERQWHPTQRFVDLPDGRMRMKFTVKSMVQVWPWIRGFGGEVEVVKPSTSAQRERPIGGRGG